MTRSYEDLSHEERLHVNSKASSLGVNPALVPNIEELLAGYDPESSYLEKWNKAWAATNEERRIKEAINEAQRDPLEDYPTSEEADRIAKKLGVLRSKIVTREEKALELQAQVKEEKEISEELALKQHIENKDIYELVTIGNRSDNEAHRALARSEVAKILPSFDSWHNS